MVSNVLATRLCLGHVARNDHRLDDLLKGEIMPAPWTGTYYTVPRQESVRVERKRHRKDRRYIVLVAYCDEQILREFPKDEYMAAIQFADGFAMAKAVFDTRRKT